MLSIRKRQLIFMNSRFESIKYFTIYVRELYVQELVRQTFFHNFRYILLLKKELVSEKSFQ